MSRNVAALEEFLNTGRYKEGLKQCEKRLKKSSNDVGLLSFKAKCLFGLDQRTEALALIDTLAERTPPIFDTLDLDELDELLHNDLARDRFPLVLTNGPSSDKLWKACMSVTPKANLPFAYQDRFNSAVRDRRWEDVSKTMVGWRQVEPSRKDIRSLQIAVYQLVAESSKDVNTVRLNTMLAARNIEKIIEPNLTEDVALLVLDVLIRQKNIATIKQLVLKEGTPLHDYLRIDYEAFMQVFMFITTDEECLKDHEVSQAAGSWISCLTPGSSQPPFFTSQVLQERAQSDVRIIRALIKHSSNKGGSASAESESTLGSDLSQSRKRLDLLGSIWAAQYNPGPKGKLLTAVKNHHRSMHAKPYCFGDLKESVLALERAEKKVFCAYINIEAGSGASESSSALSNHEIRDWIATETANLQLEYLLTISAESECGIQTRYAFLRTTRRFVDLARGLCKEAVADATILLVTALWSTYEQDPNQAHLFVALSYLHHLKESGFCYPGLVMAVAVARELGLSNVAWQTYLALDVKGIQLETVSHIGLTCISEYGLQISKNGSLATPLIEKAVNVYGTTDAALANEQQKLLTAQRANQLLEHERMRRILRHSVNRRLLILEHRRVQRITGQALTMSHELLPQTVQMWSEQHEDHRDYNILPELEAVEWTDKLERRFHRLGRGRCTAYILYYLWIDEICSIIQGARLLKEPFLNHEPSTDGDLLTTEESVLRPVWSALAVASMLVFLDKKEVAEYGQSGLNITSALSTLLELLKSITKSMDQPCAVPDNGSLRWHPSAAKMRRIHLTVDMAQSVGRFALAAQDVNKGKRPGSISPKESIDSIKQEAHSILDGIKAGAMESQHQVNEGAFEKSLSDYWRLLGEQDVTLNVREHCSQVRQAWGEVGKISFPVSVPLPTAAVKSFSLPTRGSQA